MTESETPPSNAYLKAIDHLTNTLDRLVNQNLTYTRLIYLVNGAVLTFVYFVLAAA